MASSSSRSHARPPAPGQGAVVLVVVVRPTPHPPSHLWQEAALAQLKSQVQAKGDEVEQLTKALALAASTHGLAAGGDGGKTSAAAAATAAASTTPLQLLSMLVEELASSKAAAGVAQRTATARERECWLATQQLALQAKGK